MTRKNGRPLGAQANMNGTRPEEGREKEMLPPRPAIRFAILCAKTDKPPSRMARVSNALTPLV